MYFVYISTYSGNILVIKQEINTLSKKKKKKKGDQQLNNYLVVYIKKDVDNINSEIIISHNNFKI